MTSVSERKEQKILGWGDEAFLSIIESAITTNTGHVTDISSPPGTRKTLNVIRYILQNKIDAIMSFPNHQNQKTALQYIMMILEKMKILKLKQFIIDYAGIENYCIFYKPELLMKLLDYFKSSPSDSYVDAVQNMLANDVFFRIMLAKDVVDVDEIWYVIAEALDKYSRTRNKKEYIDTVKQVVEKKGQYEICTSVCPLGLFAWWWRRELYKFFSEPKIITWRRIREDILSTKLARTRKFLVHANPENFVENIGRLLRGEFKPEWVLCPRYILMTKISMSPRATKPTFIATRKSIILTPHAGLQFILNTVKRQTEITRVKRKHILFLDEYDALLKPKTWPTVSIEVVKTIIAVAEKILSADIGDVVYGVVVDKYLKRYAEYVRDVLTTVLEIFEEATRTKTYHPIVNIFIEGAFSYYTEQTIKTRKKIEYQPLGARVVHIKHMLTRDNGRLLQLILNPRLYFYDLAEDKDWMVKYREAVVKFRTIMRRITYPARVPIPIKHPKHGRLLYLTLRDVELKYDVLSLLRDYLTPLLITPRYAVFYIISKGKHYYRVKLASVDVKIYQVLTWAKSAILVSATPIRWDAYVAGSNTEAIAESEYEYVTKDITHSLVIVEPPEEMQYQNRDETRYTLHLMTYTRDFQKKLIESMTTGQPIRYQAGVTSRVEIFVNQVSPHASNIEQYISLLRIYFFPTLQPIRKLTQQTAGANPIQAKVAALKDYLNIIGTLYDRKKVLLVLAQNKETAEILRELLNAVPCSGDSCGEEANPAKISHYVAKNRIVITYFRSRATRGIDLPYDFDAVVVVGSPYPRPTVVVKYRSDSGLSPFTTKYFIPVNGVGYNTGTFQAGKQLVARDFMNGISELVQAVGRATRSAMRTNKTLIVILPHYLMQRVMAFSPFWFRRAVRGLVI